MQAKDASSEMLVFFEIYSFIPKQSNLITLGKLAICYIVQPERSLGNPNPKLNVWIFLS